jgi:hypothetical protein
MIQITPAALCAMTTSTLEADPRGMIPMHPEDAMNAILNVLETLRFVFESDIISNQILASTKE